MLWSEEQGIKMRKRVGEGRFQHRSVLKQVLKEAVAELREKHEGL